MPRLAAICLFILSLLYPATPAFAHRVHLFAYVQQGEIVVDSRFSKARPVQQGKIDIFDAKSSKLLLQGTSDAQGTSRFTIPPEFLENPVDLRLVLKAGEGHQAEWLVPAAELNPQLPLSSEGDAPANPTARPAEPQPVAPALPAAGNQSSHINISGPELEAMINRSLDARLQPIQAMLAAEQAKGPGLTEIIGGIGWIFGIFALIFTLKNRKKTD